MNKYIPLFHKSLSLFLVAVFLFASSFEIVHAAQIPPQIFTYQGRLADGSGNLLGGSGTTYYFKFSIWSNATVGSGTRLWPSTVPATTTATVRQGVFTVNIGDTANGYPDSLNLDFSNSTSHYLQIEVSSDNSSSETLSPRQQITSAAFAQLAGAVVGTTTPSVFGTTTPATNSFVTIAATSSNSIPLSLLAALNQVANLFQIQNSAGTNLLSVNATGGLTAAAATTTSSFATTASSTNLSTSNLSIGSLSGFLKATAGVVATALVNLASDVTGILPIANGGTATSTAPVYGQLLVGNANGTYTYMATSTLGLGGSSGTVSSVDVSGGSTGLTTSGGAITSSGTITLAGILNVTNGGTGWANIQTGAIPYGQGTSAFATTTQGIGGQILAWSGGIPAWVATTSIPLAGDIGGALSSTVIGTNAVTYAKFQQVTGNRLLGNGTSATANVTELATSTLYGTSIGGRVLGWDNTTGGINWIATSTSGGGSITAVTGTWPIISSGGATPNITFGGLSTSSPLASGAALLYATGVNTVASAATSTLA
ncbi:hypothetical protein EXS57_03095, partial [Candidatus Kaiserbacteria bacterium]|nr:hypothetical protein [Candidatus Kaiserbacteria bacterium]